MDKVGPSHSGSSPISLPNSSYQSPPTADKFKPWTQGFHNKMFSLSRLFYTQKITKAETEARINKWLVFYTLLECEKNIVYLSFKSTAFKMKRPTFPKSPKPENCLSWGVWTKASTRPRDPWSVYMNIYSNLFKSTHLFQFLRKRTAMWYRKTYFKSSAHIIHLFYFIF